MTRKEHDALFHFGQEGTLSPNRFAQEYFDIPEHNYLLTSESRIGNSCNVTIKHIDNVINELWKTRQNNR